MLNTMGLVALTENQWVFSDCKSLKGYSKVLHHTVKTEKNNDFMTFNKGCHILK